MSDSEPDFPTANVQPYRDKDPARDTGRNPKLAPERERNRSGAAVFDSLVASNLRLVNSIRIAMFAMISCGILAVTMLAISAYMLRSGQIETRDMLRAGQIEMRELLLVVVQRCSGNDLKKETRQ